MAAREQVTAGQRNKAVSVSPKIGRPLLKQPTFDRSSGDKYVELRIFRMEVNDVSKL